MDQATGVLTPPKFLLARYDEAEAVVQRAAKAYQHVPGIPYYFDPLPGQHSGIVGMTPRTALADLEAKRRIVENCRRANEAAESIRQTFSEYGDSPRGSIEQASYDASAAAWRAAVRLLAAPYADHPDYRQEWKP